LPDGAAVPKSSSSVCRSATPISERGNWSDGVQLDLIQIRHLAQFLGNTDFVVAVHLRKGSARDLNVLGMVYREVAAIAIARAQRSHAQHIRDELELAPVPGPDHGAGTG
jgi:hypothetical protein